MDTFTYIVQKGKQQKSDVLVLLRGIYEPDVPFHVKVMVVLIFAYILSPVDLIPDFIPILGLLDEIILVPLLVAITARLMPDNVRQRLAGSEAVADTESLTVLGSFIVVSAWLLLVLVCYRLWVSW